jgi:hypothetical protein
MAGALALVALAVWALVTDRLDAVAGGWTWPTAALAVLEGSVAVALSLLARPLAVAPEAKFLLVAMTGVVGAFAVGVGLTLLWAMAPSPSRGD